MADEWVSRLPEAAVRRRFQGSTIQITFGEGEDPEDVKARVQGFIDLVDGLLAAGEGPGGDGATGPVSDDPTDDGA